MILSLWIEVSIVRRWCAALSVSALACGLTTTLLAAPENVRTYPAAAGQEFSRAFAVTVEGKPVPVFTARISPVDANWRKRNINDPTPASDHVETTSFASFDINASVSVTVTCPDEVSSAVILPKSYGIVPKVEGKQVTFTVDQPRLLTVEINGDWCHALHLFANPFEDNPPKADDPNVIYFGPGIHQLTGPLRVGDGKTLYLAGGAVLKGMGDSGREPVVTLEGHDIRLCGQGIIDGTLCPTHTHHLLLVRGRNITVEGITLCDSPTFNLPIRRSEHVTVQNVKIFGWRGNSDGIDICNSLDVTVAGCFLRTYDDLVVIKTDKGQGPVYHIVVKGCVLWSPLAHALSLGAELRESVDDVLFTDCDVIHDKGREWTLRVYHCDYAMIENVRFENIRIEESPRPISVWIGRAVWSMGDERGHVQNVSFKNIAGKAAVPLRIELQGFDANHIVDGVHFDNVRFNDQPLDRADIKTNAFVQDVTVTPGS